MTQPTLAKLHADWETLSRRKDYWARGGGRGESFDEATFLEVGRREVEEMFATVLRLRPALARTAALDFGCGIGRLTEPLGEHFDSVVGIDISEEQVRRAQERLGDRPGLRLEVNLASDLSRFSDSSFDLVYAHVVFQHVRPELTLGYLAEFFRVLRPGGVAVFTMPSLPRLTVGGVSYAVLPKRVVNLIKQRRDGVLMEMNPIPHPELSAHLEQIGFRPPLLEPSGSAGPNWHAFRYTAEKPASGAS